jgi:hypothetical protein
MLLPRGILLAFLVLAGCVVAPDPGKWQNRPDTLVPDLWEITFPDATEGGPGLDAAVVQDESGMLPDTGPPPKLSCAPPQLVGSSYPTGSLSEPGLRTDGLELVTRGSGSTYSSKRPAIDQPFGAWSTTSLLPGGQDPTFFVFGGGEHAIISRSQSTGGRRLEHCTCTSSDCTCAALTITDQSNGQAITDDMDGASVAVTSGGLLLAHNVAPGASASAEIYLATPDDPGDPGAGWTTSLAGAVNTPSYKEDDPALGPNGLVLLFGAPGQAGDTEIWISQRAGLTAPFPAPEPLQDVNTNSNESSPYLAPIAGSPGSKKMELFFRSNRDGSPRIYHTVCSR